MREFRLIKDSIYKFELNLNGITVLTEAASRKYVWTPIIAAFAGAKVYAFSKDSKFATFIEVKKTTEELAKILNIGSKIKVVDTITEDIIRSADIITNTGFLRPLDKEKLSYCKEKVVIPLMYETWEFRETDIDLNYCIENQIPVLGTNESDQRLCTIEYLGATVKKALFINEIEVFKSKIVILGKGKFAESIHDSLKIDAEFCEIWNNYKDIKEGKIANLDAIIIADHETDNLYIGNTGLIISQDLKRNNPDIKLIHISGNIDYNSIIQNNISLFPKNIAAPKWMSLTTDFVGPKPVIDLHTAGLKVGEIMHKYYISECDYHKAVQKSKENNLVQDF